MKEEERKGGKIMVRESRKVPGREEERLRKSQRKGEQ